MLQLRRFALLASLALASAAFAGEEDPLGPAIDAYKAGDFQTAAELASEIAEDSGWRTKAQFIVGESFLAMGKWDDAAVSFREVVTKKPDSVPALVGLGRSLSGTGSHDEALTHLEKAVKLDAKDVAARRGLGEARVAKGDADKGFADLAAAVKLDPKDPFTARSIVEIHIKAEKPDTDAAEKEAQRFVKASPDDPMGHFLLGWVLDKKGNDKEAIAAYEKAVAKDDNFIDAHKNLAILCITKNPTYQDKERTRKAFDHFKRYFELGGKDQKLKEDYEQIRGYLESNGFK
jgi:tetratricopeptide (TPR) repeat protein